VHTAPDILHIRSSVTIYTFGGIKVAVSSNQLVCRQASDSFKGVNVLGVTPQKKAFIVQ
jgi:hypothetical protein